MDNSKTSKSQKSSSSEDTDDIGLENMITDAEESFRETVAQLSGWVERGREVWQDKPVGLLAGTALAGFMVGALFRRRAIPVRKQVSDREFVRDAVFLLIAGVLTGATAAPFLKEELDLEQFVKPERRHH